MVILKGNTMKLRELLDTDLLTTHLNNHVVNAQHHHFLPLTIYNYGRKATFDCIWDDVTTRCRGLIVDHATDEVIARPFAKFFNLETGYRPETMMLALPDGMPEVTEKLDGSLGILYRYNGFTGIATRGSFASDQAAWASSWYEKYLAKAVWPDGWTPVFEIIYPDNRIVVNYSYEGLVLLACINIETGTEMSHKELHALGFANGCRTVLLFNKSVDECRADEIDNAEGYVLTWPRPNQPSFKVKVKFQEYFRLHHLMTGISPKEIWRMLKDGESFDDITGNVPAHYETWVNYWKGSLESEYGRFEQKAKAIFATCPLPKTSGDKEARKQLAEFFTMGDRKEVAPIMFKMLDGQAYDEVIWKLVRPLTADQGCFKPIDE